VYTDKNIDCAAFVKIEAHIVLSRGRELRECVLFVDHAIVTVGQICYKP